MSAASAAKLKSSASVHGVGVACALAAGVWLGAAEAPTKLVNSGLSPYAISLGMVAGVFTARWTAAHAAQRHALRLRRPRPATST